jgi:hypothetical protein
VAITAINTVIADVMFVTELDRLLALDPLTGVPPGSVDRCGDPQRRQQYENGAEDGGPR